MSEDEKSATLAKIARLISALEKAKMDFIRLRKYGHAAEIRDVIHRESKL